MINESGKDNWMHGKLIDPPSGWKYGFPKVFVPQYRDQTLEAWFVGATNYPPRNVPLALKYSRIIG